LTFDCELIALHVDRDHHRAGNGRALIAETARRIHAVGCRSIGLWVMEGNPAFGPDISVYRQ
jgi:GNAT superfamily N-acetyltransferase